MPLASEYMGMEEEAILEKIVNTDLREICGLVDTLRINKCNV